MKMNASGQSDMFTVILGNDEDDSTYLVCLSDRTDNKGSDATAKEIVLLKILPSRESYSSS